jgi:hypothetical protein
MAAAGPVTTYTMQQSNSVVEFRLYPADRVGDDLSAWFAHRTHMPPTGIDVSTVGDPSRTSTGGYTVVQKGTWHANAAPVIVIGIGCQGKSGALRYGELLAPPDMAVVQISAKDAATIMAHACLESAPESQPVATAATVRPAPQSRAAQPPANRGVAGNQIEAILFSWNQVWEVTGLQLHENAYLLLRDGSYRAQVPEVPLDEFDVVADKSSNPKSWGRWRRDSTRYLLAEAGSSQFYAPVNQSVKLAARAGETLNGRWETGSGGSIGNTGYWNFADVTLTADGRFARSFHGGVGGSTAPGAEHNVTSITAYDDEGSAGATGSRNFGGGGSRSSGKTIADRSGTYRLSGYTMELHYDNGRVERQLFFTDDDRSFIWFGGAELMRAKPGKQ